MTCFNQSMFLHCLWLQRIMVYYQHVENYSLNSDSKRWHFYQFFYNNSGDFNYERQQVPSRRSINHSLFDCILFLPFQFVLIIIYCGFPILVLKFDIQKFNLDNGNHERVRRFSDLSSSFIPRGIGFLHIGSL
ncbi:unnamed protein product [Cuscuta epithymum]|uniref:Uncharacterized protein n=1 Tax=Cuscuta epithymum TaxID=186058 RepID=A0AAV0D5M7_9ASTE|nr:unnamed protein product [Cuscuta epithymum]